jgi:hypothetical protein
MLLANLAITLDRNVVLKSTGVRHIVVLIFNAWHLGRGEIELVHPGLWARRCSARHVGCSGRRDAAAQIAYATIMNDVQYSFKVHLR